MLDAMSAGALVIGSRTPPVEQIIAHGKNGILCDFFDIDASAAATVGRIDGARIIAEAVRAARPDVRNVSVDLSTIRWTDPKTGRRVKFATPIVLRDALLSLAGGVAPQPFRFVLGRAAQVMRDD